MSSSSSSGESSDEEDITTTGLVATRAPRQTAGNLYQTLRANLDDEELQKSLLEEDELDDAEDYEGSERDDDDAAMDSSSSEDEGKGDGDAEDLEGERELRKAERREQSKRKRGQDAKMRVSGMGAGRAAKRVRIEADEPGVGGVGEQAEAKEKKRKKSERSNWLPEAADMPVRQSHRSLAVANREVTHANLKVSAERSEKQRKLMADAAVKVRANVKMDLTQAQRLEKCRRIERETAKELGRFERDEAERMRLREETLAAKRRRALEGPIISVWSGSGVYEDDKLKVKRMGGKTLAEYVVEASRKEEESRKKAEDAKRKEAERAEAAKKEAERVEWQQKEIARREQEILETERVEAEEAEGTRKAGEIAASDLDDRSDAGSRQMAAGADAVVSDSSAAEPPKVSWLSGIIDYATTATSSKNNKISSPNPQELEKVAVVQSAPAPHTEPADAATVASSSHHVYPAWPLGGTTSTFNAQSAAASPISAPTGVVHPVLREQAQRTLVILESFPSLETAPAKTTSKTSLDPTPVSVLLLPSSHPPFTSDESRYLTKSVRPRTEGVPPDPPAKALCAVTGWKAKYRDPKTGLEYADMQVYKILQRVLAGGCAWSGVLGAWVGPSYGRMGRPAKGVVEGFGG
ncbi:hypothetical protein B0A48_16329 [Cryoendolithus antarcticus]|uniref:Vps72/YL1 C-terminal domain-containing protein n=1 Tax=Cryoendolithus antarcticus TaxID=1507870 RepID=A0A1V8SG07_9PEZI|nr:hypothetical protein B0A48_16329 [Cryoendolithus antarcticus]